MAQAGSGSGISNGRKSLMRHRLPSRIQSDILFAEFCGKTFRRDQENANAGMALGRSLSLKAPHKDQIMSVSAIPPLPAFQPLNSRLGTNNSNDNNKNSTNGPNGANGSNHPNGTNTGNAARQAGGPTPDNGADRSAQATGTAATQTNPPNQQTQPHQNIQGTGLTLNILV